MNPTFAKALGVARLSVVSLKITTAAGTRRATTARHPVRSLNTGNASRRGSATSR